MIILNKNFNLKLIKLNLLKKGFILDKKYILILEKKKKNIKKKIFYLNKNRKISYKKEKENIYFIKIKLKNLNNELNFIDKILKKYFFNIPNITDIQIHYGLNQYHNLTIRKINIPKKFNFKIKNYIEIGNNLNGIDFDNAIKISQSHFYILKNKIAKLHRILIQFMLDIHVNKNKYIEINIPYLINKNCLYNTGQLPKFKKDLFCIKQNNLFLIPTAEVPLVNMFQNKILNEFNLPIKFVAYSSCFRNEQCYGLINKGLIRNKQFDKIELIQIVNPYYSNFSLENITLEAEKILILLKLPYRKILLCSNEISFSSYKTYDLEVWFPSLNNYCEISSCSNMIDYQSNRLECKFKKNNKLLYTHTLNASGVAVGRLLAAIIENYQQKDGSILIPDVLISYFHEKKIF